jgi:hypothetical protein
MKRVIIGLVIALASAQTANADVYVKVDAQGNALSGPIMCDAVTCGAGSDYSRLTLAPGESYALQGTGSSGIGNNTPNTNVKVNLETNDWTVTRSNTVALPEPIKVADREITAITTTTVETFNPVQPVSSGSQLQPVNAEPKETVTATIPITETITATSILDEELDYTWKWEKIWEWIIAYLDKYWGKL